MKINPVYTDINDVSINDYLLKCGVKDPLNYLKGNYIEPFEHYKNINVWCEILHEYLNNDDNIIYLLVDSDYDGFASGSLFYNYCKLVNPNCYIIPIFHEGKGHGLSDTYKYISKLESGLLVILDAGSRDKDKIQQLTRKGFKIIVADHHECSEDNDFILVNNQMIGVENKGLSGTGVTWKCLNCYDKKYGYKYSNNFISYVMVSLISDSCPLIYDEQFTFIKWGKRNVHKNLIPLVELNKGETNHDYSFGCIPLINSVVRMGTQENKSTLFKLFCGELNESEINEIIKIAKELHKKQSQEANKLMNKVEIITDKVIVLGKINEPTTLTGYVAQKISKKYNKPVFLVHENDNRCGGSFRSNFNISDIISNADLLTYDGGHDCAGGVSYSKLDEDKVIDYIDNLTLSEPVLDVFISLSCNCLSDKLFSFVDHFKTLWGKGIDYPIVYINKFTPDKVLIYDKVIKIVSNNVNYLLFNVTDEQKEIFKNQNISLDIIGEPSYNYYRNQKEKQIVIQRYNIFENKKLTEDEIFA